VRPDLGDSETLALYAGSEAVFTSGRHWLHPLFDLEAFLASSPVDPAGAVLLDRITGRAAAFLVARLGLRDLRTGLLSRRAIPVLEAHGITYQCRELVDKVACATEDLLAEVRDPEAAWAVLQERRARALAKEAP